MELYPIAPYETIPKGEDGLYHVPVIDVSAIPNILTPASVSGIIPITPPFPVGSNIIQVCAAKLWATQYISYGWVLPSGAWYPYQQWYPAVAPYWTTGYLHKPIDYLVYGNWWMPAPVLPWGVNYYPDTLYYDIQLEGSGSLLTDWHVLGLEPSEPGTYEYPNPYQPDTPILIDAGPTYNGFSIATRLAVGVSVGWWCYLPRRIAVSVIPLVLPLLIGAMALSSHISVTSVPSRRSKTE